MIEGSFDDALKGQPLNFTPYTSIPVYKFYMKITEQRVVDPSTTRNQVLLD